MRGERGEHASGDAAVTIGFSRTEDGISLIDDDDDRTESADGHENAHLLPFGIADPFGAELAHFHYGEAAFTGKAVDKKGFADANTSRDKDPAFDDIVFSVFDEPRQFAEFLFGGCMGGDDVEGDASSRIFKAHQSLAILFDKALFA